MHLPSEVVEDKMISQWSLKLLNLYDISMEKSREITEWKDGLREKLDTQY
jgi:hypothetical protein